ncbi:MAG: hypothetical protein COY39_05150 [Alphaproteobacteria bacterium CG_4_10_14_0_8_um_filter_37_21]|nr:MAG: hypothetical protein COY39_05150 [Alphaproteobacteria bacterium CG_4_10_14_0_8_um_filter_37_21]
MSVQKKILPLLSILILTQNEGRASWWEEGLEAAKGAIEKNKDKVGALVGPGSQALQAGATGAFKGGSFQDFTTNAQAGFETGQKQDEALKKATEFYALQDSTFAQKNAIQTLYQQQEYTAVITIVDQTTDIFTMLANTSDAVKKKNEQKLQQMSQAFNYVNASNIVSVTNSVYTFVKGIAPAGSSTNSMSDADFNKKVIQVVEAKYGDILKQLQSMLQNQGSQNNNNFTPQSQASNNMFMGG